MADIGISNAELQGIVGTGVAVTGQISAQLRSCAD